MVNKKVSQASSRSAAASQRRSGQEPARRTAATPAKPAQAAPPRAAQRPAAQAQGRGAAGGIGSRFAGIQQVVRETIAELRKVQWPDRLTTRNLTLVVIGMSAALAAILGALDAVLTRLVEWLIRF